MLNYASPLDLENNTNSLLSITNPISNGTNTSINNNFALKKIKSEKKNLLLNTNTNPNHYYFSSGEIKITNIEKLTQSISNLKNIIKSDIYSFLDKEIESFNILEFSDNENRISKQATEEARFFLRENITKLRLSPPKVKAIPLSEINLNWNKNDFHLDMAIVGDGTYSFYMKDKITGEEFCYDLEIKDQLPGFIVEKLNGDTEKK
jgi:hypothetical protein